MHYQDINPEIVLCFSYALSVFLEECTSSSFFNNEEHLGFHSLVKDKMLEIQAKETVSSVGFSDIYF